MGLLLVAQRIEELLFDYTLDTYKAPALNTHTRCIELSRTIQDVRDHLLTDKALAPVVEELAWSVSRDLAARNLLGPMADDYSRKDWWAVSNISVLAAQVDLLRSSLRNGTYERQLVHEIRVRLAEGRKKGELLAVTTDLVVEWLYRGYSRGFIFYWVKAFFFSPSGPEINSVNQFSDFVTEFDREPRKYEVILRLVRSVELDDLLPSDVATVRRDLQPRTESPREHGFFADSAPDVFLVFSEIEACDARAAATRALTILDVVNRILVLHAHRERLDPHPTALVYQGQRPVVLGRSTLPTHKEYDCQLADLPANFGRTLTNLLSPRLPEESWSRISAALALHASALNSEDPTVQLTALWSALEALLPTQSDQGKVAALAGSLGPALCRYYPLRLVRQLESDLERCIPRIYKEVRESLGADIPEYLQCASIIAIQGNEPLRDKLYEALARNPLLKFRVFQLKGELESADKVRNLIENHRRRVQWHIRRIYRSRNLLVHAGRSLPYLTGLVENLHAYFHKLLEALDDVLYGVGSASSIDAALLAVRLAAERHGDLLAAERRNATSAENLLQYLCGPVVAYEAARSSDQKSDDPMSGVWRRWRSQRDA